MVSAGCGVRFAPGGSVEGADELVDAVAALLEVLDDA
jgi:hypothetical protein